MYSYFIKIYKNSLCIHIRTSTTERYIPISCGKKHIELQLDLM